MKKTSILFVSALFMIASAPVFAQEDSLFQIEDEQPVVQQEVEPVQVTQRSLNQASSRVLNELRDQTQTKASSIANRNKNRTNPQDLINGIESLKQQYLQQTSGLNGEEDSYIQEMQDKCEAEIQARMLEEQRMAELESDGVTLNSRGQKRLDNDIAGIKDKYEKLIDSHKKNSVNAQTERALLSQINSAIRTLESSTYTQSSISDENLKLSIGEYDGTKDVWPYTVVLYLAGQPVATFAGNLSYSDISGKQIPAVPRYSGDTNDAKAVEYSKYLDSVEIFDASFKTEPLFVEAQVTYTVKAKNPSEPSSYTVTVNGVQLKNIITEKIINTYNCRDQFDLNYSPASPVEWTASPAQTPAAPNKTVAANPQIVESPKTEANSGTTVNIFPPISIVINVPDSDKKDNSPKHNIVEPQQKQEPKREAPVENRKNNTAPNANVENTRTTAKLVEDPKGKKSVSALLYCLPGTINFYSTPDGSDGALSLGYNLQFTVCPRLFLGVNLEFGLFQSDMFNFNRYYGGDSDSSSGGSSMNYFSDDFFDYCGDGFGFYLITAQIGSFVNLNNNIRFNYFGEAGICSDNFVAGAGCNFEFYSNTLNWGATVGYTGLVWDDLTYLNKLSFGLEFLF